MDTKRPFESVEVQSGTGARPSLHSSSHTLAQATVLSSNIRSNRDSPDDTVPSLTPSIDSDAVEEEALLRTPDQPTGTSDHNSSERGSSLLEESPHTGDVSVASPTPMEVGEYIPTASPRNSPSPPAPLPPAPTPTYRPCSPSSWIRASRRYLRPRSFNIGYAYSVRQRSVQRAPHDPSGPPSPPARSRGSRRGVFTRRPTQRGRGTRQETNPPPRDEWYDWTQNLPKSTPAGFNHPLASRHPWGLLVRPRPPRYANITSECTTSELPLGKYRPIPPGGYHATRWVRSLFPKYIRGQPTTMNKIPVMELQTLEAAIQFREESLDILNQTLAGQYQELVRTNPQTPRESFSSTLAPPVSGKFHPVLYQVVATGYGAGVILEAKDFFIIGPDRRDLHSIVLEQFAIDVTTDKRGFDQTLVSIKDLVWVYSVAPTRAALQDPTTTLAAARVPRATALEASSRYFQG